MCVEMNKNGIWIDQKKRFELEVEYEHSVIQREKRIRELGDDLSPGSYDQIRHLLYEKWKLPIPPTMDAREFYTDTGLPGTDDNVLRAHMAGGLLSEKQSAFIRELRLFRREKNKILGTVLIPLRTREEDPKKGLVWEDGRVRSCWNAHVTSVGRLSSSGPNLQNIGNRKGQGRLKSVFAAPPGRIFVGADLDQAHLRITANYWKIPRLLECFEKNLDPHGLLCQGHLRQRTTSMRMVGDPKVSPFARKPPKGKAKSMRDVMKTFRYASIYWADPNTVWRVLTSDRDGRRTAALCKHDQPPSQNISQTLAQGRTRVASSLAADAQYLCCSGIYRRTGHGSKVWRTERREEERSRELPHPCG
jgi:hypothetical protein